jgi:hypothetical protein
VTAAIWQERADSRHELQRRTSTTPSLETMNMDADEERCDNDEIAMATSIEIKLVLREKGASLLDHVRKTWHSKNLHVVVV